MTDLFRATRTKKLRAEPRDGSQKLDLISPDHIIEVLEVVGEWRRVRSTDLAGNKHEGFIKVSLLEIIGSPKPASETIDEVSFVMALTAAARDHSGVNRDYLTALAWVESELKNTVDDETQATGPFQFSTEEWNEMVAKYGPELGIAHGDIIVPGRQAAAAAKKTAIATDALRAQFGQPPNSIELYLSFRLGLPAALKVLSADNSQPIDIPIQAAIQDADLLDGVFNRNADLLKEGENFKTIQAVLSVIAEKMDTGLQKAAEIVARLPLDERTSFISEEQRIGELSANFEAKGPDDIGFDSTGGHSYGSWQISTKTGTMAAFLDFAQQQAPDFAQALETAGGVDAAMNGDPIFKSKWKELAQDPELFNLQYEFIKSTHYDVQVGVLASIGLDVEARSFALRNVVWSVAVQHGPNTPLIKTALAGKQPDSMSDREIIDAIYTERSNVDEHFENSTFEVKSAVGKRFVAEHANAVAMLA
jgi:hypothetical protein